MKPGDLVTIRKWNLTHRVPVTYVNIYDRIDGDEEPVNVWKWEHGEVGVIMGGRDGVQEMVQVLHKGRIGWIDEEMLRAVEQS